MKKVTKKQINKYLIKKYMGGRGNTPPAKNIQYELEDGYEFQIAEVLGKEALTIKKIK